MRYAPLAGVAAMAALATVVGSASADDSGFTTTVKPYVKPVGGKYSIRPLLSVGDRVPETGNPSAQYQMIGIPDGLGLKRTRLGSTLFMNHELPRARTSEPVVGGPLNRGSFVSKYRLNRGGSVRSGERAYDSVFAENAPVGPAPASTNATPAFARFCSGFLAGRDVGFDRTIYLTGEEEGGADNFDGRGGQSVAIYDNELHTLPRLGRFKKENNIVMPKTGKRTVIFPTEDGPASPDSQLWMYVGRKDDFTAGTVTGHWVRIPDAASKTESELEAAADAVGAFGFIRPEDGAASKTSQKEFYFVTTGGDTGNRLGRAYGLRMNPGNPTQPARLTVIYNADQIIAAGGDVAISPDNVDTSEHYLMINEDGTEASRPVMAQKGRDGSVWRFDLRNRFARERVAELQPPGRDGVAVGPGVWETSGIIETRGVFGRDTWVTDVQAHPPTAQPFPNTVEDGQLVLMRPAS